MNFVVLVGRLGKDAVQRTSAKGKPWVTFSMATERRQGETRVTDWHNVVAFGKFAENPPQKGDEVFVEGEYTNNNYEKDGKKIYGHQVVARRARVIGGKAPSQNQESYGSGQSDYGDYDEQGSPY